MELLPRRTCKWDEAATSRPFSRVVEGIRQGSQMPGALGYKVNSSFQRMLESMDTGSSPV